MKDLLKALRLIEKYEAMTPTEVAKEFEDYTGQKIPKKAIDDFTYNGLTSLDLITSDWLEGCGLKNLFQFKEVKSGKKVKGFDVWYQPCGNCGHDPGKSVSEPSKRCWKCGSQVYRDFSERALKPTI